MCVYTGSNVEYWYGVPARSWAVGAGSRRAVYSVLAQLLCRFVCCVCVWCTSSPSCSQRSIYRYSFMAELVRHSPVFQQQSRASMPYTSILQPAQKHTHFCLHSANSRGDIVKKNFNPLKALIVKCL